MSLVKATKLKKRYNERIILSDLSFSVEKGDKIALTGLNGSGKSTLLKILSGQESYDDGKLVITKGTRIGYLPQDAHLIESQTINAYIKAASGEEMPEHRVHSILAGFDIKGIDLNAQISTLSSGQKTKVLLAGILLAGADLLLLDEPTNNLDLPALVWLEDFIKSTEAACVVVSHDRRFLDRATKKIFEIDRTDHTLTIRGGSYSEYLAMVAKELARQKEKYRLQQDEIERLSVRVEAKREEAAEGRKWAGTDNDKLLIGFKRDRAKKSTRNAKVLENRIKRMDKVDQPFERAPLAIDIDASQHPGTKNITAQNVVAGYEGGFKTEPFSLDIAYGSRVAILGLNGAGKSTAFKTLTGVFPPLAGTIDIGSGLVVGNLMQEHESLRGDATLLETICERTGLSTSLGYAKLVRFGFNEEQAKQAVSTLSPGGRARLLFAIFSAISANVLVLDEPTNHLDIEALDALEEALATYQGTVLLATHDRYFLEKARVDTAYLLEEGILTRLLDYREYIKAAESRAKKLINLLPKR